MKTLLLASALLFGSAATTSAAPVIDQSVSVFDHVVGPKTVRISAANLSNGMFTFERFFVRDGQLFVEGMLTGMKTDGTMLNQTAEAMVTITGSSCNSISLTLDPIEFDVKVGSAMITQSINFMNFTFNIMDRAEYKDMVGNKLCLINDLRMKGKASMNAIAAQLTNVVRSLPYTM
jgi:hypothetical protein